MKSQAVTVALGLSVTLLEDIRSLLPLVDGFQFESVTPRLVALHLQDLGDIAKAVPSLDVQQQVDGVGEVGLDGGVG